jgi:Ca2+-transporting ATPase
VTYSSDKGPEEVLAFLVALHGQSSDLPSSNPLFEQAFLSTGTPSDEKWHSIPSASLVPMLETRFSGLSEKEAQERLRRFGPNTLESLSVRSAGQIWIDQFRSFPVALLGVAAGLSLITAGTVDMVLILATIGFNAIIGFVIDSRTERKIELIWRLGRPTVHVMRGGKTDMVPTDRIVPGDILVLGAGNYVAADARVLEAYHLNLDEAALTKKETFTEKRAVDLLPAETPLTERINMVYRGALVLQGHGLAVVVAIGTSTELGRLKLEEILTRAPETRLERQLAEMEKQLTLVGTMICGIVFFIGLARGYPFMEILTLSVSLGGGAIPEGLTTIAATTLSLGVSKARKHNILIRRLNAVETLGSIETFCFDKAGMITVDRPVVIVVFAGMRRLGVSDSQFFLNGEAINPFNTKEIVELIQISVLCSRSEREKVGDQFVAHGPSLDNALLELAVGAGIDLFELNERFPRLKVKDSGERKGFLITVHPLRDSDKAGKHLIAVRGEASDILPLCRWQICDNVRNPMKEDDRHLIEREINRLIDQGARVIGFAFKETGLKIISGAELSHHKKDLTWVGFVGLIDPLKDGITPLISAFHKAGIETVMVTDDPPATASVIGKKLGLERDGQYVTMDSPQLTEMEPELIKALAEKVQVISRASAAQKQRIVKVLQSTGRLVAMTGDELADIPSMMTADIGIALGQAGREMARDVAEVVLEENNLETMIIAVSHGRTIYNNIRKSVHYLLSTNLSEVFLVSLGIAAGTGSPLNTMQLLWIDLMSDTIPSFALAFEPPEPDIMEYPPRPAQKPILESSDLTRIAFEGATLAGSAFGAYGYGLLRYGHGRRAGTIGFMGLTLGQILHAQSCRSEHQRLFRRKKRSHSKPLQPNRMLQGTLWGSLILQGLTLTIPGLRNILGLAPIGLLDGAVVAGTALLPLIINEGTKPE